jgi:hypothetical protein
VPTGLQWAADISVDLCYSKILRNLYFHFSLFTIKIYFCPLLMNFDDMHFVGQKVNP